MLAKKYHREVADHEEVVFLDIYKNHYQVLFRHGFHISRDKELTKECIQQMFFELWRREDRFGQVNSIEPYLKKCLERKLYSELRTRKNHSFSIYSSDPRNVDECYETLLIKNQTSHELTKSLDTAMKCLTKRQMQLIELRFMKGLSFDEMGKLLGIEHRTMYNQLHSAITILREKVKLRSIFPLTLLASSIL